MKTNPFRPLAAAIAATFALSKNAEAHPGHSVLDFTAGPPHPGHESEWATLLISAGLTVALFGCARWLRDRRR